MSAPVVGKKPVPSVAPHLIGKYALARPHAKEDLRTCDITDEDANYNAEEFFDISHTNKNHNMEDLSDDDIADEGANDHDWQQFPPRSAELEIHTRPRNQPRRCQYRQSASSANSCGLPPWRAKPGETKERKRSAGRHRPRDASVRGRDRQLPKSIDHNRPEPPPSCGKWMCGACDYANNASRAVCHRCARRLEHELGEMEQTTCIVRNISSSCTRDCLVDILNAEGSMGCFDFLYLPTNFARLRKYGTWSNAGYFFINMSSRAEVVELISRFEGATNSPLRSKGLALKVEMSDCQGYQANVDRYRNSQVFHPRVHDKHRPVLFQNGIQQPFPQPTRKIKLSKSMCTEGLVQMDCDEGQYYDDGVSGETEWERPMSDAEEEENAGVSEKEPARKRHKI